MLCIVLRNHGAMEQTLTMYKSKNHVKLITCHVWQEYMVRAEDIRYTIEKKNIYQQRKETIEQLFRTAKEQHGFQYTQYAEKHGCK